MKTRSLKTATLVAAALVALSGCGSSDSSSNTAPSSTVPSSPSATSPSPSASSSAQSTPTSTKMAKMAMITIKNFAYQGTTSVKPGTQVMVVNADSETHTLTSDQSGQFDVNVSAGGGTAMFTAPTKTGSYAYHCQYHANMHGTLVVK